MNIIYGMYVKLLQILHSEELHVLIETLKNNHSIF